MEIHGPSMARQFGVSRRVVGLNAIPPFSAKSVNSSGSPTAGTRQTAINAAPEIHPLWEAVDGVSSRQSFHHLLQPQGILGRVAVLVVVEKTKNFLALIQPGIHRPRPAGQCMRVILALIGLARAMQPDMERFSG